MRREPASAVIVRTRLPSGLERVRQTSVADAAFGLPAHVTLLYPFVAPSLLRPGVRRAIASVAARHAPFAYRLVDIAYWPLVDYAALDPVDPFVAIQADLAAAFPEHPIYGWGSPFAFVPHVTIVERPTGDATMSLPTVGRDRAGLPRPARAAALEVIADRGDGWRLAWRLRLGGRAVHDAR